ncbi:hypothetical protein INQ93_00170 [Chlamydia suis]|uniref:Inclusion membrane protein-51 n=1 Tax=Chlamydia suis TaxID=83559 RepID=A0ABX6IUC8_9CHLA|nr:cysteine-rich outer membrane protein [Chlamydia suis]QHP83652.1 Inclusion membrane protein-51 [Chlamydia suis]QYC71737.1 hypothetical protein INQ81_00165 [Chlamydia suis]QYC72634.1 hypothetical protein INQ82_00165 [Chlamydia suis]QYC73529.1 hypothetical protein INQ83_00165 [Chlamydia suis]QYC78969.1 hypothetical protein INQ89_00165 [Chlamydia suis]
MSTVPVVSGATSPNASQDIPSDTKSSTLKDRASSLLSSTAFKVGLVVVGALLVIASIALLFIVPEVTSVVNASYLTIPAILGCVNICMGILSINGFRSGDRWALCKTLLKTSEDFLDDGTINNSNKVFTENNLNHIEDTIKFLSKKE